MPVSASPLSSSGKHTGREISTTKALALARDLREHVHIDFLRDGKTLFQGKGAVIRVSSRDVSISLHEPARYMLDQGTKVNAFFFLPINRKKVPFSFNSALSEPMNRNEAELVTLVLPEAISHRQRRYNYRIPVSKEDIDEFKVWACKLAKDEDGNTKPDWIPIEPDMVNILDFSASGAQLALNKKSANAALMEKNNGILLSGKFQAKNKEAVSLVLAGKIVRQFSGEKAELVMLGLNFTRWSFLGKQKLQWINANYEDGIAPLAAWIASLNLARTKA